MEFITRHLPYERAKLLETAYMGIRHEVRKMMRENNISAAINFDGSLQPESEFTIASLTAPAPYRRRCSPTPKEIAYRLRPKDPEADIHRLLDRLVVANDFSIDITPFIVKRVNARLHDSQKEAAE